MGLDIRGTYRPVRRQPATLSLSSPPTEHLPGSSQDVACETRASVTVSVAPERPAAPRQGESSNSRVCKHGLPESPGSAVRPPRR